MKTKFDEEDFKKILRSYNIGSYFSHKHLFTGGNTVYLLKTSKGKFILKVYENAKLMFINDQIKVMRYLNTTQVTTPQIINTQNGSGLLIWKGKRIAIQEFVEGKEIKKVSLKLVKDAGNKLGILSRALLKYDFRGDGGFKKDHEFRIFREGHFKIEGIDFNEETRELIMEMSSINRKILRKSAVHADLCESNVMANGDKVTAIIDWDDFHYDYLVFDVSVFLGHVISISKQDIKKLIKVFLHEYGKYIKFNSEERIALYYFTKKRILDGAIWSLDIIKKHPDQKRELTKWAKGCSYKYRKFSEISLEEFLKLF